MINLTHFKIPKKYHLAIREICKDEGGIWCFLNEGYVATKGDGGQTIREDTFSALMRGIRAISLCDE